MVQAQQTNSTKMPEAPQSARTLLIKTLLAAETRRRNAQEDERPSSVTAYHLSNSGQSNPLDRRNSPLDIYYLPLELTTFLATVQTGVYRQPWNTIVQRAWQRPPEKKGRKRDDQASTTTFEPRYNSLYEDLFRLPDNAPRFIRTYFLRIPRRRTAEDDATRYYSLRNEWDVVSWLLVELFLGKVIRMDSERIENIRRLGDMLAEYVEETDDKRFFRSFFVEQRANNFRTILLKANLARAKSGKPPLFGYDAYINVFYDGEEVLRPDWRLIRDLLFIRMVERLYPSWIGKNQALVDEVAQEREDAEAPNEANNG